MSAPDESSTVGLWGTVAFLVPWLRRRGEASTVSPHPIPGWDPGRERKGEAGHDAAWHHKSPETTETQHSQGF